MKASLPPERDHCKAFRTGKSLEVVQPPIYALPRASTGIDVASSPPLPPRTVANTGVLPVASSLSTNAVEPPGLPVDGCIAPGVVRNVDVALPLTYALPPASTAMALGVAPATYVE